MAAGPKRGCPLKRKSKSRHAPEAGELHREYGPAPLRLPPPQATPGSGAAHGTIGQGRRRSPKDDAPASREPMADRRRRHDADRAVRGADRWLASATTRELLYQPLLTAPERSDGSTHAGPSRPAGFRPGP